MNEIARRLAGKLPERAVLVDREALKPYECDGLSAYRETPLLAALPADEDEVKAVLDVARESKTPVVARGSGTGLSGGALPLANGILLSMAKFNRVVEVDALARQARVQPGVTNLRISQHVASLGLYYAPDPSSQIACSIGGNVAENSGGVHCLKYGLTVHNVARVRAMSIEGEILELGSGALDAPGYDLLALVHGSEGLLAITLEVTVKLLPKPEAAQVIMASFSDVASAGDAVAEVIGAGIVPAGLEMMDKLATRAVEGFVHAGYDLEAAAILLAESDGTREEVAHEVEAMTAVMRASGATDIRVSQSDAERLRFWSGRKAAFPAVGRISPDYYCIDGSIPRGALAKVLERTEAFAADLLELCIEVGGTITGEHGVGIEKINQMCSQFRPAELAQFHALKAAFDPDGLLNPGKMVPTLHRCAEYGAMRVKGGALPHPELERF